jgi:hypothetical protein
MIRLTPFRIVAAVVGAVALSLAGYVGWKSYDQMTRGITYIVIQK